MDTQNKHSWIGIILVALGGLMIVDNFGIFHFNIGELIFSWHTIFIIIGAVILANSKTSITGIIFLLIGLWGMASDIFPWFDHLTFGDLWPIFLIIIGFSMLVKKNHPKHNRTKHHEDFPSDFIKSHTEYESSSDIIDEVAIFTSSKRYISSQNFKGGKVTAVAGGITLDFSNAKLAPGENQIEITCIFGGCKIYVPRGWKVIVNVTSVFGGIDDKRFVNFEVPTSDNILVIKGAVIFGGSEIFSI